MKKILIVSGIFVVLTFCVFVAKSMISDVVVDGVNDYFADHYHNRVETFKALNKLQDDVDILFVGDSITEMYDVYEFFDGKVVNRGISSDTISGLLKRMNESILDLNPKKVVFMMGTNDIMTGRTEEEIIDGIEEVLTIIQNELPDTEIIVESLYPINKGDEEKISKIAVNIRTNEVIDSINAKLVNLTSNMSIEYVDVNAYLKDENGQLNIDYTLEGLHLNSEGYQVVTDVLKPILYN